MCLKKLAIITTHPVQYNTPLFKLLAERNNVLIKVFYTWGEKVLENKFDPGFGIEIKWDIPLLEGYQYEFIKNIAKQQGSDHYTGIDNPNLIREIVKWDAEAILVYGWNFKSHLKTIRYFHKKIPVLFRGDSSLLDFENPIKKLFRKNILHWVYSHVDTALFVGHENKRYFKYSGLKENQLVFAPQAIDNKRFRFEGVFEDEIRSSLNIPASSIVFLFAGKLEPKKNPILLLNTFLQLNDEKIHVILAGNGILEKSLKLDYGNHKNIHFIPFQNQSQMPGLYKACDVFVLPSQGPGETWGLSVNEAMACGKAVLVSTKCGCAIDLVENGENGFIFESGNEYDLKNKMQYFIENPASLERMGLKSLEMIEEWSYENVCKALEGLLISKS